MVTKAMPAIMALFTLYVIRYAVKTPPQRIPIHICTIVSRHASAASETDGRAPHDMAGAHAVRVQVLRGTAGDLHRGRARTGDGANARGRREAGFRQEQADAAGAGNLERRRDDLDQPLPHAHQGQQEEDQAFDKHGRQSKVVGHDARSMAPDDLEREVRIQSHAGAAAPSERHQHAAALREAHGHVGSESEQERAEAGDGCRRRDEIPVEIWPSALDSVLRLRTLHTRRVLGVVGASGIFGVVALAIPSRLGQDGCLWVSECPMQGPTHIDRDDVGHGKEGREPGADLGQKAGAADLLLLDAVSRALSCEARTCPEPSSRKMRPNVDAPTRSLTRVHARRRAFMVAKRRGSEVRNETLPWAAREPAWQTRLVKEKQTSERRSQRKAGQTATQKQRPRDQGSHTC